MTFFIFFSPFFLKTTKDPDDPDLPVISLPFENFTSLKEVLGEEPMKKFEEKTGTISLPETNGGYFACKEILGDDDIPVDEIAIQFLKNFIAGSSGSKIAKTKPQRKPESDEVSGGPVQKPTNVDLEEEFDEGKKSGPQTLFNGLAMMVPTDHLAHSTDLFTLRERRHTFVDQLISELKDKPHTIKTSTISVMV